MYKIVLAAVAGCVVGAGVATLICYKAWYKNAMALINEIDKMEDDIDSLLQEKNDLYDEFQEYKNERLAIRFSTPIDTVAEDDDDDDALCEEDGVPEVPVNHCTNPRFIVVEDDDTLDYWSNVYTVVDVYAYASGEMYRYKDEFEVPFYADEAGGNGNVTLARCNDQHAVIDNARGLLFLFNNITEEEEEPDFYENEFDYDDEE